MTPLLICQRWQVSDRVFLEIWNEELIHVDVGPYEKDPSEDETNQAYEQLVACQFPWLSLGDERWMLNLDRLASAGIPALATLPEIGLRGHEPAFESGVFPLKSNPSVYLRIVFQLKSSSNPETEESVISPAVSEEQAVSNSTPPEPVPIPGRLFTPLSPAQCLNQLKPYEFLGETHSLLLGTQNAGREFAATLGSQSALVRKAPSESELGYAWMTVDMRSNDEGTLLIVESGVRERGAAKASALLILALGLACLGWVWRTTPSLPPSYAMYAYGLFLGAFLCACGYFSLQSRFWEERTRITKEDIPLLFNFLTKTLSAEPLE